jgi:inosose dehydratase
MAELDKDLVGLCVDTGHCVYAGINPSELIETYQDRVEYLHFKDINKSVLEVVTANNIDFYTAIGDGVFCPLGQGCVDFSQVKSTLEKIDYQGWITVEQDVDPNKDNSSLENAKQSLDFINTNVMA